MKAPLCIVLMLLVMESFSQEIDLDKLFSDEVQPRSHQLESSSTSVQELRNAEVGNSKNPIGKSALDAMGSSMVKGMQEGYARQKELAGSDYDKCQALLKNSAAYTACIKDISALQSMGDAGLKAVYAIQGQCSYLAGFDSSGLSYLCENPNINGCSALKASQDVRNDCGSCNGNNLWLRVYAASGHAVHCY